MSQEMVHTEARQVNDLATVLSGFAGSGNYFSTLRVETPVDKIIVLKAMTEAEKLDDHVNTEIAIKDFIIQLTDMVDENGEVQPILRTIVIDDTGAAYSAASDGVIKALQTFVMVAGHPETWAEPLRVRIERVQGRRGWKFLTLRLV